MTKDNQIKAMVVHSLEEPGHPSNEWIIALVVLAVSIERGVLIWDDERKVCIKVATGEVQRLLH